MADPIILIGMGRSGTTIINRMLCQHPMLGYLTQYHARLPQFASYAGFSRAVDTFFGSDRALGVRLLGARRQAIPSEAYPVWARVFGDAFRFRTLHREQATAAQRARAARLVATVLRGQRKERFCAKFTGPPRLRFLASAFPDALFVEIVRDPRAVVASLLNVDFWKARGLDRPFWEDILDEADFEVWRSHDKNPAVLATLQWQAVNRLTEVERQQIPNRVLRIRYEEFVEDPLASVSLVLGAAGLMLTPAISTFVATTAISNQNHKATSRLGAREQALVDKVVERPCNRLDPQANQSQGAKRKSKRRPTA